MPGNRLNRISGKPSCAPSSATITSEARAHSKPPPSASPCTSAILVSVGLKKLWQRGYCTSMHSFAECDSASRARDWLSLMGGGAPAWMLALAAGVLRRDGGGGVVQRRVEPRRLGPVLGCTVRVARAHRQAVGLAHGVTGGDLDR